MNDEESYNQHGGSLFTSFAADGSEGSARFGIEFSHLLVCASSVCTCVRE